jgi:hypothetical protein
MTLLEKIQQQLNHLPPEKQSEVLDFAMFLRQQVAETQPPPRRSLRQHPAFGAWRGRNVDAVQYQQDLRTEWDAQP